MELLLISLLPYLISLAANERTAAIHKHREEKFIKALNDEESLKKALASCRSIKDELRIACAELARTRAKFGITPQEEPLWRLLSDDNFINDIAEWLMAGCTKEGTAVKERLLGEMERAIVQGGASRERVAVLKNAYFEAVDKAVFSNQMLSNWRHQLSLDYLQGQVDVLRLLAEEAVGVYSDEKQRAAIDRYCEKCLAQWDIVDLGNLPGQDVGIATQKLLLRQLYMPLRIIVDPAERLKIDDSTLEMLEEQRDYRRHREASYFLEDELDRFSRDKARLPVGERLRVALRLVVLGDPGGGKTTMLRWMATAYLLRYKGDQAFDYMPDTKTLPDERWIPVLIRCRDLGDTDLCRCFTDFLTQHLNKTQLLPEDANIIRAVILKRIAKGEALLLVDGLDEITNPQVRMMFCQELERTAARYPEAPILVTSRIVGYRDMDYRMKSGFEHGVIADLDREDKDLFAQRWVDATEQHLPPEKKAKRTNELIEALHSNDRIERLTGNPMMLTTLALVKRKVGKLPNRRTELYAEAVTVLLNWNPKYEAIDKKEAIPQLEYLAYEMCRRGVQRLTEDEVLDLLEKLRIEYRSIHAIRERRPHAFLTLLEARSSILIKSGDIWQKDKEKPVWEFRHLTFQEYLAARALLDGHYPNHDKSKSLAQQVAPLAGRMDITGVSTWIREPGNEGSDITELSESFGEAYEIEMSNSWSESLRLLVADCKDDDVDDVMLSILNPLPEEDAGRTGRPRAILASLCLADEPNISEEIAQYVCAKLANYVEESDGEDLLMTTLGSAALNVGYSMWSQLLKAAMIEKFYQHVPNPRLAPGLLWGEVELAIWSRTNQGTTMHFETLVKRLQSSDRIEMVSAAFTVWDAGYAGQAVYVPSLIDCLFDMLKQDQSMRLAAAGALFWLSQESDKPDGIIRKPTWAPSDREIESLIHELTTAHRDEVELKRFLIYTLGNCSSEECLMAILSKLDDPDVAVHRAVAQVLSRLCDMRAVDPLLQRLDGENEDVSFIAAEALARLKDARGFTALIKFLSHPSSEKRRDAIGALAHSLGQIDQVLLSQDHFGIGPWIDPAEPITRRHVTKCANRLDLAEEEVRSRYESLAADFPLKLDWQG